MKKSLFAILACFAVISCGQRVIAMEPESLDSKKSSVYENNKGISITHCTVGYPVLYWIINQSGETYGITGEFFPFGNKDGVIIKNITLKAFANHPIHFFKFPDFKDMTIAMCQGIRNVEHRNPSIEFHARNMGFRFDLLESYSPLDQPTVIKKHFAFPNGSLFIIEPNFEKVTLISFYKIMNILCEDDKNSLLLVFPKEVRKKIILKMISLG